MDAAPKLHAFDVLEAGCPSRRLFGHVTGRWGALVLASLRDGPLRFGALRRRVGGISEKMLSQTLQALEAEGMVRRDVQAVMPPKVEYSLSPQGEVIAGKVADLIETMYLVMRDLPAVWDGADGGTA